MIRDLKEKYCFVSCDIEGDIRLGHETTYYNKTAKLPDKRTITISDERFQAPEILFHPALCQIEQDGVHEMIYNCIQSCPMDTRKGLYESIVLSGANTMFPGFASRLEDEIRELYVNKNLQESQTKEIKIKMKIIDSPRRKISVFIGACIVANIYNTSENSYWITKQEWEENGEDVVLKCPNQQI